MNPPFCRRAVGHSGHRPNCRGLAWKFPVAAVLGLALAGQAASAAAGTKLTILDPPPGYNRTAAGTASVYSTGLNNAGQSVGRSRGGVPATVATLWDSSGAATALAAPADTSYSRAFDINNSGVIVGTIESGGTGVEFRRAVRWTSPASYDYFLADNGFYSDTFSINDNGWISGLRYDAPFDDVTFRSYIWSPDGTTRWIDPLAAGHTVELPGLNNTNIGAGFDIDQTTGVATAVRWSESGGLTVLDSLGGGYDFAGSINGLGVATGAGLDASGKFLGVRWDTAGHLMVLGQLPAAIASDASYNINDAGFSVGVSLFADCADLGDITCYRATLWDPAGNPVNLNDRIDHAGGLILLTANAINDSGMIFGQGLRPDGRQFAYLLSTVPEPSNWALIICGIALAGAVLRRRHSQVALTA